MVISYLLQSSGNRFLPQSGYSHQWIQKMYIWKMIGYIIFFKKVFGREDLAHTVSNESRRIN